MPARHQPMHVGRPAGNGPDLIPAEVANPYEVGPRTIPVIKNAKACAVTALHARGTLGQGDDASARLEAATWMQRLCEAAEIGGSRAIDYSRVKVDVSFRYRGVPDRTVDAVAELARVRKALRRHYDIVEKVCGYGLSLTELAQAIQGGPPSWRYKRALSKMLVDGLDKLIEYRGVARGSTSIVRAERAA